MDSGVASIRKTRVATRSHQAPTVRAVLFCLAAQAWRDAERSGATGRVPDGPRYARTPAPPPRRPTALLFRGLAARPPCPSRPPRASMATAAPPSRAAKMSRSSCGRLSILTGMVAASGASPTSPLRMQSNNTGFGGEAGHRRPQHLSAPETAAHTATEGSAQAHSELAPPNLRCPRLLKYACASAFRVHLHGR